MFWNHLGFCRHFWYFHIWSKFPIILILYKIFEKLRFPWNFSKNLDFDQNCSKSRFWSTFIENRNFCQFSENLDFGQDFRNISVLVEIFLKKISNLVKFSEKFRLRKKSRLWLEFSWNLHFGQNFRETSDEWKFWKSLSSKYSKIWNLDKIFVNRHFGKKN